VPSSVIRIFRTFSGSHELLSCEVRGSAELPFRNEETLTVKLVRELGAADKIGRVYMFKPSTLHVGVDNAYHNKNTPMEKVTDAFCDTKSVNQITRVEWEF
jgi:hypothetical protein